ncbi:hypothetical protein GCM10010094_74380 [Streptomyces flaveus]|uniref:Uncharacterized protein n=1 Tax=Streptomyces flaveus TaxID=66370 RepID=A0A917VPY4_9ACTN|nr:hypothetical protein GCM10010094_74380 [Streptomyces flaveus]
MWLVAQFPAPLKSLRLPAPKNPAPNEPALPKARARESSHPNAPSLALRREGSWAGASYAHRLAPVSENPHPVPAQGRMPALRRADAPAHDPAPPTHPRGAGNGATSHPHTRSQKPQNQRSAKAPGT